MEVSVVDFLRATAEVIVDLLDVIQEVDVQTGRVLVAGLVGSCRPALCHASRAWSPPPFLGKGDWARVAWHPRYRPLYSIGNLIKIWTSRSRVCRYLLRSQLAEYTATRSLGRSVLWF